MQKEDSYKNETNLELHSFAKKRYNRGKFFPLMPRFVFLWSFVPFFLLVPFAFSRTVDQTFELPKFVAFLILSSLFLLSFLTTKTSINFFSFKKLNNNLDSLLTKTCVFGGILILLVNVFLSVAPQMSFWGGASHHQGFLLFFTLFLISGVVLAFGPTKKEILLFFFLPLAVISCVQASIAVGQFFVPNFLFPDYVNYDATGRSFGTFGQPNSLARFLTFVFFLLLPIAASFFTKAFQEKNTNSHSPMPHESFVYGKFFSKLKVLFLILLPLLLSGILATGSRASFLALAIGTSLFFLFQKVPIFKIIGGICTFFICGFVFLFFSTTFFSSFLPENILRSEAIETRFELWKATPELIKESPYIGYGLETYPEVFPKFMPEELVHEGNQYLVPDRSHNEIMDFMVHIGIPGTLIFILILVFVLWRGAKKGLFDPVYLGIFLALLSGIIARQFEFGTTTDYMLLAFFAPLFFLYSGNSNHRESIGQNLPYPSQEMSVTDFKGVSHFSTKTYWLHVLLLVVWSIFIFLSAINFWQADSAYDNALEKTKIIDETAANTNLPENIRQEQKQAFEKVIREHLFVAHKNMPWEPKYALVYADRMVFAQEYEEADIALNIILNEHPFYADGYFIAARLAWQKGEHEKANELFKKATELAPAKPVFWREWGKFLEYTGNPEEADKKWKREAEILRK